MEKAPDFEQGNSKESILNEKKVIFSITEIEGNEKFKNFVLENKNKWFFDPYMPLHQWENDELVSNTIYFIDEESNFCSIEIDYKKYSINHDNLPEELTQIGLTKIDNKEDKIIAKELYMESSIYQNSLDVKQEESNIENEKEEFRKKLTELRKDLDGSYYEEEPRLDEETKAIIELVKRFGAENLAELMSLKNSKEEFIRRSGTRNSKGGYGYGHADPEFDWNQIDKINSFLGIKEEK